MKPEEEKEEEKEKDKAEEGRYAKGDSQRRGVDPNQVAGIEIQEVEREEEEEDEEDGSTEAEDEKKEMNRGKRWSRRSSRGFGKKAILRFGKKDMDKGRETIARRLNENLIQRVKFNDTPSTSFKRMR